MLSAGGVTLPYNSLWAGGKWTATDGQKLPTAGKADGLARQWASNDPRSKDSCNFTIDAFMLFH